MKNKKIFYSLLAVALLLLFVMSACNEYNEPAQIFQPEVEYPAYPTITAVSPAGGAVAGVREITITGTNFSSVADSNHVFIGDQRATVKSASTTSITVYRPASFGNPLALKVEVPAALKVAEVNNYFIDAPIANWSDFTLVPRAFYVMDMDRQGNLWIGSRQYLYMVSADGFTITPIMDNTNFLKDRRYIEFTEVKCGPGGLLYVVVKSKPDIYTIDPATPAVPVTYATLPNNTAKMDIDDQGNIYSGQANGVFYVDPAKNVTATGHYTSATLAEIRIIRESSGNKFLYVADSTTIHKNAINSDGSLGADQLVVDIRTTADVSSCVISSFNVAADGFVYLALKKHPQYAIFAVESDGSVTPFYQANILPIGVDQIVWGIDRHLYLNRGRSVGTSEVRMYRMGLDRDGAPYLGR